MASDAPVAPVGVDAIRLSSDRCSIIGDASFRMRRLFLWITTCWFADEHSGNAREAAQCRNGAPGSFFYFLLESSAEIADQFQRAFCGWNGTIKRLLSSSGLGQQPLFLRLLAIPAARRPPVSDLFSFTSFPEAIGFASP